MAERGAPGELELVREFLNTADIDAGTDALDSAWLRDHGLDGGAAIAPLAEFREALRALLLSPGPDAAAALDRAAREAPVLVSFGSDGGARLVPASGGAAGVLARLLGIVARAQADGTWTRLKACPADACGWAFYDHSRNRSRSWCSMSVCGNRAKARSFRARRR